MKFFWWSAFKAWIVKDRFFDYPLLIFAALVLTVMLWSIRINFEFYKGVYHYFSDQDKVTVRLDSTQVAQLRTEFRYRNDALDTLLGERERLLKEVAYWKAAYESSTVQLWSLPSILTDTVSFVRGYEAGLERAAALATLEAQKGFAWDVVSIYEYDSSDQFVQSTTYQGKIVRIAKASNFYDDTTSSHLAIGIYDNRKGKVRY